MVYQAIPKQEMENWIVERLEGRVGQCKKSLWKPFWQMIRMLKIFLSKPEVVLRIAIILLKVLMKELSKKERPSKSIFREVYRTYLLVTNTNKYNAYAEERCKNCL